MKVLVTYPPSPGHLEALAGAAPRARIRPVGSQEEAAREIGDSEVVLGNRWFLESLPRAGRLRWMQSNSVGMDRLLSCPAVKEGPLVLTCARGVYDDEMADHGAALVLALARGLHHGRGLWRREPRPPLRGRRALILGAGGVGTALARRLQAFGVVCEGVCRRPREHPEPFRRLHLPGAWRSRLGQADILALTLPLTPSTVGILDGDALAGLPEGALVVNVARGELLDEDALRRHLPRLGGAGLDVFRTEPLPEGHWMWASDKVLVSPHVGRSPEAGPRRFEPLFVENLRRYARGEPLLNVVDKEAGY